MLYIMNVDGIFHKNLKRKKKISNLDWLNSRLTP